MRMQFFSFYMQFCAHDRWSPWSISELRRSSVFTFILFQVRILTADQPCKQVEPEWSTGTGFLFVCTEQIGRGNNVQGHCAETQRFNQSRYDRNNNCFGEVPVVLYSRSQFERFVRTFKHNISSVLIPHPGGFVLSFLWLSIRLTNPPFGLFTHHHTHTHTLNNEGFLLQSRLAQSRHTGLEIRHTRPRKEYELSKRFAACWLTEWMCLFMFDSRGRLELV